MTGVSEASLSMQDVGTADPLGKMRRWATMWMNANDTAPIQCDGKQQSSYSGVVKVWVAARVRTSVSDLSSAKYLAVEGSRTQGSCNHLQHARFHRAKLIMYLPIMAVTISRRRRPDRTTIAGEEMCGERIEGDSEL